MKVTGGCLKGRSILTPKSRGIRPAEAHLRKSLFDILGDVKGWRILDLFAGTGSYSIEALSRGAAFSLLIDKETIAIKTMKKNLENLGLKEKAKIVKGILPGILKKINDCFDLVIISPPYFKKLGQQTLQEIGKRKKPLASLVVVQHHPKETFEKKYGKLKLKRLWKKGDVCLSFYVWEE